MFLGEYQFSLDSKARLTLPAKYRELLAPAVVVSRHPTDRCLVLWPMPEWERLTARISGLSIADGASALLRRKLFSAAEDIRPDAQGRILLSQRLRGYARIESDVAIIGQSSYIELWNPADWQEYEARFDGTDLSGELFAALGI